jgi:hypothetical protein
MSWDAKEFNQRLKEAVNAFDRARAAELCDELTAHLHRSEDVYPEGEALKALSLLQSQRLFDLMARVGDALVQDGQRAPAVRRQYAQAMLNIGHLTAALQGLELLSAEVPPNSFDYAEVQGLTGRVYKQLYVNARNPASALSREHLYKSLRAYYGAYTSQAGGTNWHGINAVALLCRAERDGVPVKDFPDPRDLAAKILADVEQRDLAGQAGTWDFTDAAESCVALGRPYDALDWMARYIQEPRVDAFFIGSTLRQLEEVWQLDFTSDAGLLLVPVLRAALLERQGGLLRLDVDEMNAQQQQLKEPHAATLAAFEKVFGADSFVSFEWYRRGLDLCRSVARLGTETRRGLGTGFLVCGKNIRAEWGDGAVLVTNAHVLSPDKNVKGALRPDAAVVFFEALSEGGQEVARQVKEVLWTSPPEELDATVVRLSEPVEGAGVCEPTPHLPLKDDNQHIYIIGHPGGGTLSFSIHDNLLLDHEAPLIHYRTPTEGGSSGSPVFNQQWRLIGLHHKGGMLPRLNNQPGTYEANEGIWIESIRRAVAAAA